MKRLLFACLIFGAVALLAENLLPPIGDKWEVGRNADGISTFAVTEFDGKPAFHVNMRADTGYTLYRCYPELPPGDYTFSMLAVGESANGLYAEAYSFDKADRPSIVMRALTPAGVIAEPMLVHEHFRVPEGSAKVRVGVGITGKGEGHFMQPSVESGRRPVPKEASGSMPSPIQTGWIAEWIYLKDDPGVPRVDFSKSFTLDAEPSSATVQLTADNGYELLVNGKSVGSDVNWQDVELYDIAKNLRKGRNTITVHVMNYDGIGGLVLQGLVVDADGAGTEIKTDGTWDISLPDGGDAKLTVHGKVPMAPWGVLPFHRIIPPKTRRLNIIESQTSIVAGYVLHFVFDAPAEFLNRKGLKLSIRFTDNDGRATPLSAFDPFVRFVPEHKRLYVDLATSGCAMPGEYVAELVGGGFLIPAETVRILPGRALPAAGALPRPSSHNYFITNNLQSSLFTYSLYSAPAEKHYRSWAETGGHLYEANLPAAFWNSRNVFSTTECEATLLKIIENDPHARIVLKFRIDVPGWWVSAHPDDVFVSNNNRRALQSFCSETWRHDAIEAVSKTLQELAARPVGNAIAGVLLMGFRGGEFQLWGEDSGEYDCSPVAKKAFEQYQKSKGLDRIVALPHPALAFPLAPVDDEGARVRDLFFRFVAERHADNLAFFVRDFQRRFGTRYSIGMYFGYGLEYAGDNTRMLLAGHLGLEPLLAEAPPDMLSCPLSYSLRPLHRSHAFMFPVESARLHGTMPIGENDVRNCLTPEISDSSGTTIFSLADSIADNRRIRLFEAAHGATVRYLALHPTVDWYFDHAIVRSIKQDNEFVMPLLANPIGGKGQVALVANYLEWTRGWRINEKTFRTFAGEARDTLMRTGRPVSFLTFDDFASDIRKWDNALIPIPGLLTPAQRTALEAAFGTIPIINMEDGALLLHDCKWSVLNAKATAKDIWKAFATEEALAAGFDTIWYVGGNYKFSWNSKTLTKHKYPEK